MTDGQLNEWEPTDADLRLAGNVVDFLATVALTDRDRNRFERVGGDIDKYMLSRRLMGVRLQIREST